ncbi:MAG: hypothetical protein Q7R42_05685 [Candidatus Planktophila sp.]|nr:hypothetical protein [Candidatus Planktophila sp.]
MDIQSPVVLKLEGGLGNQLFELAAGYYLAAKLDSELHLDQYSIPLTTVHGETGCGFEPFGALQLPNSRSVRLLPELPSSFIINLAKRSTFIKRSAIKMRLFRSNPNKLKLFLESNEARSTAEFFEIDTPMKLHGNFQSWEIVERAAQCGFPRIFRLRNTPQWIIELENTVDFKNSIVLHFRVGDDTRTNHNFRQPEIGYYLEALRIIKSKRKVSNIYILSDDIPRVKEMYGDKFGEDFHYLEMPNESSAGDRLYVLSLFGGIVCANSTFCGWAAWSIYNSGGEVVVPVPYSDGPVLGSRDFPSKWHQLDKNLGTIVA